MQAGNIIESNVRSYCRAFPGRFSTAQGCHVFSSGGKRYLDFLAGCGALNYGHNHPRMREALIDYIMSDGIALALDLATEAKERFLELFGRLILTPRNLDYSVQFTGPTGANAVEAAIKLARKVTGRSNILAFTNGFHGCSLGALSLTANSHHRSASAALLNGVQRLYFDGYFGGNIDTADLLSQQLHDPSGGLDAPAAIILEVVQGEGGLNIASRSWLRKIAAIARSVGALLIVDEVQTGCGRTGNFFAFEKYGIVPDIVTLAKSISGFGLPMSLVLMKPELDQWSPGEHSGTFRGNNHAFVTAAAALQLFWSDDSLASDVQQKAAVMASRIEEFCVARDLQPCGTGLMQGISLTAEQAGCARAAAYERGLIAELCGPHDEILKFTPPLVIEEEDLHYGLKIAFNSIDVALRESGRFWKKPAQ